MGLGTSRGGGSGAHGEALRLEIRALPPCGEEGGEGQSRPLARLDQSYQDHLPRSQEESVTRGAHSVRDTQRRKWLLLPPEGEGEGGRPPVPGCAGRTQPGARA